MCIIYFYRYTSSDRCAGMCWWSYTAGSVVETRSTCVLYIFTGILVLTGVLGCVGGLILLGLWWRLGLPVYYIFLQVY